MASSMWTDLANQYGEHFSVPPALILSLIDLESGGDPNDVNPNSGATGLLQVTRVVLRDYNKRHGLKLSMEDLKDPGTNIRIGAELLRRIALTYEKRNGITPRWDNKAYIGLVIFGWNAGYSAKTGVSSILSRLQAANVPRDRWNIDLVHAAALKLPSVGQYLKVPTRVTWSKRVADRTTGIEDGAKRRVAQASNATTDKPGWSTTKKVLIYGGIGVAVVGTGYALLSKGEEDSEGLLGLPSFKGGAAPIIIINK